MMKLKNKILDIFIDNKIIEEEDRDVYEFGLVTMFFTLGKISLLLVIFSFLGEPLAFITFIVGFSVLRYFSGGLHSKSAMVCTITTFLLIYITIHISKLCFVNGWDFVNIICVLISIPLIFIFAPGKVKNRPITKGERIRFKAVSRKIVILMSIVIILLTLSKVEMYEVYVLSFALLFQSLNIISKKEDSDETFISIKNG